MAIPVVLPKATITLESANILCWRKHEGDYVRKDEILFEMETDKVIVEVPAPADGVLLHIAVAEGAAQVEQVVGWLGERGEAAPAEPQGVAPAPSAVALAVAPGFDSAPENIAPGVIAASPAARRRARELGVDLSRITGSGPGGRITERDVDSVTERHE